MPEVTKKKKFKLPPYFIPLVTTVSVLLLFLIFFLSQRQSNKFNPDNVASEILKSAEAIDLPHPSLSGRFSVEAALQNNQAYYEFENKTLTLKQVSQMLWAGQGITTQWGGRTTTSPRSSYPLTLFLLVENVEDLEDGLYRYYPGDLQPAHQLIPLEKGEFVEPLALAVSQNSILTAPAVIIITGDNTKIAERFDGQTFDSKMYLEAGHVGQNIYLQAESLSLGVNTSDTEQDDLIREFLNLPSKEDIIYLVPFGYPKTN